MPVTGVLVDDIQIIAYLVMKFRVKAYFGNQGCGHRVRNDIVYLAIMLAQCFDTIYTLFFAWHHLLPLVVLLAKEVLVL